MCEMNTYRLRRVCIRMVSGVKPSVCSQHCIKHSVASDHPMICGGGGKPCDYSFIC